MRLFSWSTVYCTPRAKAFHRGAQCLGRIFKSYLSLLGGNRNTDGSFLNLGANGNYWSATERDGGNAYNYNFNGDNQTLNRNNNDQGLGLSVRCLQNLCFFRP